MLGNHLPFSWEHGTTISQCVIGKYDWISTLMKLQQWMPYPGLDPARAALSATQRIPAVGVLQMGTPGQMAETSFTQYAAELRSALDC